MALLATRTKLAMVQIVRTMTADAITSQRRSSLAFWRLLLVTGLTTDLGVFALQAIFGLLVVVKLPERPGTGVVAVLAKRAELLLVLVFLLVATQTITRRVLVARTLMASLAGGRYMAPRQRETCQPMVKLFDFP